MNKQEFLNCLQKGLSGLPKDDVEAHLTFYAEMIDDRIEEGFSESQAVADIGAVDKIVSQIAAEIPLTRIVKEKCKTNRRPSAFEITLLALGSPLWLSLLIAVFAVALSLFAVLWSLVIALWAIEAALFACVPASLAAAVLFGCQGYPIAGTMMLATALICAGLAIFLFFGCRAATKGSVLLMLSVTRAIKKLFIRKEKRK